MGGRNKLIGEYCRLLCHCLVHLILKPKTERYMLLISDASIRASSPKIVQL